MSKNFKKTKLQKKEFVIGQKFYFNITSFLKNRAHLYMCNNNILINLNIESNSDINIYQKCYSLTYREGLFKKLSTSS